MNYVMSVDLIDCDTSVLQELQQQAIETRARFVSESPLVESAVIEFLVDEEVATCLLLQHSFLSVGSRFSATTNLEFDFSCFEQLGSKNVFWILSFLSLLGQSPAVINESDVYLNLFQLSTT